MTNGLISVIVPVYNIEQYVEKTIESIQQQTYMDLEIVLIDDGSADESGTVLDCIVGIDPRVTVIHKCNGGVTEARIKGIGIASGDWIGFVDGDDYIEPDMYETLLSNALLYHADISHCGYQMVFPSRVDYYYNTKKTVVQDNRQGLADLLRGDFVEPGLWNKLYKGDIVRQVVKDDIIDTSIKINEDVLMNYYFFKLSHNSFYFDICPYHYMLRNNSAATSTINPNKLYDPITVQKLILNDISNDKEFSDIVNGRLAFFYIRGASMKKYGNEKYVREFISVCRSELKQIKPYILKGNYPRSSKIKLRLCCFSPALYRGVHMIYAKAKGTDNRYEVR